MNIYPSKHKDWEQKLASGRKKITNRINGIWKYLQFEGCWNYVQNLGEFTNILSGSHRTTFSSGWRSIYPDYLGRTMQHNFTTSIYWTVPNTFKGVDVSFYFMYKITYLYIYIYIYIEDVCHLDLLCVPIEGVGTALVINPRASKAVPAE
jgi:hypothetical protein